MSPPVTHEDSPNRLTQIKNFLAGNKPPKEEINCTFLYNLIVGLESRIKNLERAHTQEIEDLKMKHASDIASLKLEMVPSQPPQEKNKKEVEDWLVHTKREFPLFSDGLRAAESKLETVELRLQQLEQTPPDTDQVAAAVNNVQANQVGVINLVAMDQEVKSVRTELNAVNNRAKQRRRRAHLEGDQRDQYSRREILRVTGVPYMQGENTSQIMVGIACELGVCITEADISVSHRSGRRGGRDPRPILCKFVRRDVKNKILANKKFARNIKFDPYGNPVRIFVDEDLTRMRANVAKKLRQDKVPHYTRDGKFFIATNPSSDTEYNMYDSPEDWEKLPWIESVMIDVGVFPRD